MLTEYSTSYKPIKYQWAYDLSVEHEKIHWIEQEVELGHDVHQWHNKLTEEQREYLAGILKMFTLSDVNVAQNYHEFLIPVIKNTEVRGMLSSFAAREMIHVRAYAMLNDTLGLPESLYEAYKYEPVLGTKHNVMVSPCATQSLQIFKNILCEGVLLFGSFAMLLNFQRHGLMPGTVAITRFSLKEESLHVKGLARLFLTYNQENRVNYEEITKDVYSLSTSVYQAEADFIDYVFKGKETIDDCGKEDLKSYIKYLIDRRLIQCGIKGLFNQRDNPLPWIDDMLGVQRLENFFETRVTEYSVGNLQGEWCYE